MNKMMRLSVLCAAGILFSQTAFAADEKIGFVDLGKLMQESTAYQGFMMQREKEFKSVSASLEKERQSLAEKEREIAEAGNDSSKAELGEKLDKLDKGLTDFAVVFGPLDLTQYHYLRLPGTHRWGLLMRKDRPLSQKVVIEPQDLLSIPLIYSAQAWEHNEFSGWLGFPVEQLHIVAIYNLFYNASLLVQEGMGYATSFDHLAPTGPDSPLCHRPFHPSLQAVPYLLWKKSHRFSKASRIFLDHVRNELAALGQIE